MQKNNLFVISGLLDLSGWVVPSLIGVDETIFNITLNLI